MVYPLTNEVNAPGRTAVCLYSPVIIKSQYAVALKLCLHLLALQFASVSKEIPPLHVSNVF